jgi:hypothetical protein
MPEPKGNDVQRTLAVRVSPDYHAQLSMVAQVDEMSLTDLMMKGQQRSLRRICQHLSWALARSPGPRWRAWAELTSR